MSDVLNRIAAALERLADSHSQTAENSRKLVEDRDNRNIWKDQYEKVYEQNTLLLRQLESTREMALKMGESFRREWDKCHDGSEKACSKKHEGDE